MDRYYKTLVGYEYDDHSLLIGVVERPKLGIDTAITTAAKNAGHDQAMTTDNYAIVDLEEQKDVVNKMYAELINNDKEVE